MNSISVTVSGSKQRVLDRLREARVPGDDPARNAIVDAVLAHVQAVPDEAEGISLSLYVQLNYLMPDTTDRKW